MKKQAQEEENPMKNLTQEEVEEQEKTEEI
jgi:hypothetical protein